MITGTELPTNKYSWAVNQTKVDAAIEVLTEAQKSDATIVIDEASIKAKYIELKGELANETPIEEPVTPTESAGTPTV